MISVKTLGNVYELRGLSTDTKPTEKIGNGSLFIEMDTSKIYYFEGTAKAWAEFGSGDIPTPPGPTPEEYTLNFYRQILQEEIRERSLEGE